MKTVSILYRDGAVLMLTQVRSISDTDAPFDAVLHTRHLSMRFSTRDIVEFRVREEGGKK